VIDVPQRTRYGRCPVCGQLKRLNDNGQVWAHNQFGALSTVVFARRCSGSEQLPTEQEGTTPCPLPPT
jgi:hypothetical protein